MEERVERDSTKLGTCFLKLIENVFAKSSKVKDIYKLKEEVDEQKNNKINMLGKAGISSNIAGGGMQVMILEKQNNSLRKKLDDWESKYGTLQD